MRSMFSLDQEVLVSGVAVQHDYPAQSLGNLLGALGRALDQLYLEAILQGLGNLQADIAAPRQS